MASVRGKSEAEQRRQFGGYSAAELDAEFVRSQRSDPAYVAFRLATLAFVYALLARGILAGQLGAAFLLLPVACEFLLMMWFGQWLSRRVVSCKTFAKSAGSPALVVFWTVLVLAIITAVLAWDSEAQALRAGVVGAHARAALATVVDSGLLWAVLAMAAGLGLSTMNEVARWKRRGGVFVWTSITDLGMRIGMFILVAVFGGVLFGVLGDAFGGWIFAEPQRRAWLVYGLLLLIDMLALVVGVLMHRDLSRKQRRGARGGD